MKKNLLFYCCIIVSSILLLDSISSFAAYNDKVTAEKSGVSDAYSLSTGSLIYSSSYGGSATSGTLHVTAQYYDPSLTAYRASPATLVLSGGQTDSSTAYIDGAVLWRVHLHGITGRGNGWIQGR